MTEAIAVQEIEVIEKNALELSEKTKEVCIDNDVDCQREGAILKSVKKKYKEVNDKLNELLKPFQESKKKSQEGMNNLKAIWAKPLELLKQAEGNIKQALLDYDKKLEDKRIKEQRILDEQAAKEQRRLDRLADKQQVSGNTEKAEETRERAVSVPRGISTAYRTPIKGISKRDNWIFVITDPDKIPREYLIPDEKKLSQVAKAHKGMLQVSGVAFKNEPIIASGT